MASVNVLVTDSFLSQVERVGVELKEKVARAHQVLHETALLSELQQLGNSYRRGVDKQIDQLSLRISLLQMDRIELLSRIFSIWMPALQRLNSK